MNRETSTSQSNPRSGTSQSNPQSGASGQQRQQGLGSPISNEAYNVISTLHAKLEGLEAMRKYGADDNQIWQKISQSDLQCVDQLVNELETMVRDNKLRMGQPGKTQ